MKKLSNFLLSIAILMALQTTAQTGLNFQGVARSENGVILASQAITLRLSIVQGTANGTAEYTEIRKTTTNAQGLFSVVIGDANTISSLGNFSTINWSNAPTYLKIEMDPAAGENFVVIGTTQLQSVAYAKLAESVAANNINGTIPVSKGGTGKTSLSDLKIALQLDQVNNTADLAKPISTATQAALDVKANIDLANSKEDTLNKSKNIITDGLSDTKYPTVKAVKTYIDDAVVSGAPDATTSTKGKIALAGVLTGTAELPEIADNKINTQHLMNASVTDDKIVSVDAAKLNGDITGKANNITGIAAIVNGGTGANNANDARANLELVIGTNVESPLSFASPLSRISNVVSLPVASSSVNGYISSSDWTNFNSKVNASEKASNNGIATLDANGKIPSTQIPAISFQSANVVSSQSAMLALSNAVVGSIAIRTDNNNNYVLSATPASTLSNWIVLATPTSVTSVNGLAGPNVSLTTDNITEGTTNKYYSNTQARNAISAVAPLTYDATAGAISIPRASSNQAGYLDYTDWIAFNNKIGTASATATFVPYTGATRAVDLGAYDLTVNGLTVGRGNNRIANNTAIGVGALSLNSTGYENTGVGTNVLLKNTSGYINSAFGSSTLINNVSGFSNAAFGNAALYYNTTGSSNAVFGTRAMLNNTTGSNNTALGNQADVGSNNLNNATAIGSGAVVQASNTIQLGDLNVTGVKTSGKLTTGTVTYPNAHGTNGQLLTTTGSGTLSWTTLTGISSQTITTTSLTSPFDLTTETGLNGSSIDIRTAENLSNGTGSLSSNTDGIANVAFGIRTLKSNTTGAANTGVGFESLYSNTTGQNNTSVGAYALRANTTGNYNSAFGSTSLISNTTGYNNASFGEWSLISNTIGSSNTGLGANTLFKNTTGNNNTAVGVDALNNSTTASYNTALGVATLRLNTTGEWNTAGGFLALESNTTGASNTAFGASALRKNTVSNWNSAFGSNALFSNTTGGFNTAVGGGVLELNTTGTLNTAVGAGSLHSNTISSYNTAYGSNALYYNTIGNNNTSIGSNALTILTTGSNNTAIGYNANVSSGTISNSIVIGANAIVNTDNTIQLGNTAVTDVKTVGKLTTGAVTYPNAHGTNGQVLSTTGSGTLTWTSFGGNYVDITSDQTIGGNKTFSSGSVIIGLSNRGSNLSSISFPHVDDPAFISHDVVNNVGKMRFSAGDDLASDYFAFGYGVQNSYTERLKIYANGQLTAPIDAQINGLTIGMGSGNAIGNTVIGNVALLSNTTGQFNTAVGAQTLKLNSGGVANTALGNEALSNNTTGNLNVAIGASTLLSNTSGSDNTAVGTGSMFANTTGTKNAAFGHDALRSNTIGIENTATGNLALFSNTEGVSNTASGAWALYYNTVGNNNTGIGYNASAFNTYGMKNTSLGSQALYKNTIGNNNTSIGTNSMMNNNNGSNNTAIGQVSSYLNTTGSDNTSVGAASLYNHGSGNYNTAIGSNALLYDLTGNKNTAIGYKADVSVTGLTNATAIGSEAVVGESNTIALGSPAVTKVITAGKLTTGTITYPNTDGAQGQILATDGSGNVVWADFNLKQYTLSQRSALTGISEGTTIYNTTTKGIEYYNGTAWVPTTHYVGESYGGGTVFYVYDNGQHGLIVSNTTQSTGAYWRAGTDINTMALATGIGAGQKNTAIIIASQGYGNADVYAARICNEYSVTDVNGVTYGDWYLPSKYELGIMFAARSSIPSFLDYGYWSSTELDAANAYIVASSGTLSKAKNLGYSVRAIRRF